MSGLGFLLLNLPEPERAARCRELRALALVYLGLTHRRYWIFPYPSPNPGTSSPISPTHPVTKALGEAVVDAEVTDQALVELSSIPALRKRRLLSAYAALLPGRSG
jgi:hypothetical protein